MHRELAALIITLQRARTDEQTWEDTDSNGCKTFDELVITFLDKLHHIVVIEHRVLLCGIVTFLRILLDMNIGNVLDLLRN